MRLREVNDHIGDKANINGSRDLAMDSRFRPYLYPRPEVPFVFTIIKTTRGGQVYLQCDSDKKFITVNAGNVDLMEV